MNRRTGIGRYTEEIVRELCGIPDLELRLLVNSWKGGEPRIAAELGLPVSNPRWPDRVLRAAWRWLSWPPVERFTGPVDVFHASDWVFPPTRGCSVVSTVHDLGALAHPEWYAPDVVRVHRRMNRAVAAGADRVIAISEYTKEEFLRFHAGYPEERVHVVPNGVSAEFSPMPPDEARGRLRRLGLPERFLLYVGTRERRKNVPGLVEIFRTVADEVADVGLVLAGMRPAADGARIHGSEAWSRSEVEGRIRELGLGDRVTVTGSVTFEELRALYSGASAFVFPSLYEGFGLPILEAMSCACPVVAAGRTAIPEVVGDAGLLADPDDVSGFAGAVVAVLRDRDLARRLRDAGVERAERFTWARSARRTARVYRAAATAAGSVPGGTRAAP